MKWLNKTLKYFDMVMIKSLNGLFYVSEFPYSVLNNIKEAELLI